MRIEDLLVNIKNKNNHSKMLFQANSGKVFEDNILEMLTRGGEFISVSPVTLSRSENFRDFKKTITSFDDDEIIHENKFFKELTNGRKVIIPQPFGSQMYPDFLVMSSDYILPIEIKFSTRGGGKPTWNSGLPRTGGLYIFGSYLKGEITFFMGQDMIKPETKKELISLFDFAEEKLKKEIENRFLDFSEFDVYMRRMYNQKKDIIKSQKRNERETQALDYVITLNL